MGEIDPLWEKAKPQVFCHSEHAGQGRSGNRSISPERNGRTSKLRARTAANWILPLRLQVRFMLSRCWDIQIMSSRYVNEKPSNPN